MSEDVKPKSPDYIPDWRLHHEVVMSMMDPDFSFVENAYIRGRGVDAPLLDHLTFLALYRVDIIRRQEIAQPDYVGETKLKGHPYAEVMSIDYKRLYYQTMHHLIHCYDYITALSVPEGKDDHADLLAWLQKERDLLSGYALCLVNEEVFVNWDNIRELDKFMYTIGRDKYESYAPNMHCACGEWESLFGVMMMFWGDIQVDGKRITGDCPYCCGTCQKDLESECRCNFDANDGSDG